MGEDGDGEKTESVWEEKQREKERGESKKEDGEWGGRESKNIGGGGVCLRQKADFSSATASQKPIFTFS